MFSPSLHILSFSPSLLFPVAFTFYLILRNTWDGNLWSSWSFFWFAQTFVSQWHCWYFRNRVSTSSPLSLTDKKTRIPRIRDTFGSALRNPDNFLDSEIFCYLFLFGLRWIRIIVELRTLQVCFLFLWNHKIKVTHNFLWGWSLGWIFIDAQRI